MKYKVFSNINKNKNITVEIGYDKCTRNVRPFPFYQTESRQFFFGPTNFDKMLIKHDSFTK